MLEGAAGSRAFAPDRHICGRVWSANLRSPVKENRNPQKKKKVIQFGCSVATLGMPHSPLVKSYLWQFGQKHERECQPKGQRFGLWRCSSCSARGGADSSPTAALLPFYGPPSSSPSVLTCLLVSPLCSCNCAGIQQNPLHLVNMSTLSAGAAWVHFLPLWAADITLFLKG